jgi:hypothetical protein
VGLFALELRHQIDVALGDIRQAESAADDDALDVSCGRLADLVEIADRHGLTTLTGSTDLTELVPLQCGPVTRSS